MRILYFLLIVGLLGVYATFQPNNAHAEASQMRRLPVDRPMAQHPMGDGPNLSTRDPLTLAKAIQIAMTHNPEIAAVRHDFAASVATLESTKAGRWPTLNLESGYANYLDPQRLIPARYNGEPGVFGRQIYRTDVVLKLPLFTGGRITSNIDAAELLSLSEQKRLARTREEMVFNVSSVFYTILNQREVIRSFEFSINTMGNHRKQVADLLAAKKAARVDLLRVEVRLADLRQSLLREQSALAAQKRLLINLMGVDAEVDRMTVERKFQEEPDLVLTAQELVSTALRRRKDYLAAKDRLEAQARRVDSAKAGYWPTINLVGSYGMKGAPNPSDEGSDTESVEDIGFLGVTLAVPLFEGGFTAARVRQERAVLGAARERLRRLQLQIRREVETALLDIQSSTQRIEATRRAIEQAKESLRIERMKYDLGSGSMTDVLDAQSALLQSQTNLARAEADYQISKAKLRLATGKEAL